MAMMIGGVNPYIRNYNRMNHASHKTIQEIIASKDYPSAAYSWNGYVAGVHLSSRIGAVSQSIQNTQNVSAMIKTAAGATDNTVSVLSQIKDQLINAANDTNNALDRKAIQNNLNQLVSQIDSNAYVQYNGKNLLDGSQESLTLAGIDGYENFPLGDLRSQGLGLTDAQGNVKIDVSTPEAANNSLAEVGGALNFVEGLNGTLDAAFGLGLAMESALDAATTQGAQLQRLEYQEANYTTMQENQISAQVSSDDNDIAKQVTKLRNEETLQQISLFAINLFNHNRASVMNLLP